MLCNNWRLIFYWLKYKENKKEMLAGQQKHKNAYDMITLGIKNTMEFYRFLNEEKKKKSRNRKVIVMNDMKYIIESLNYSRLCRESG